MTTDELQAYEDILPGLAERIQAMVSEEEEHRQRIERRRLMLNSSLELAGQAFGFTMAAGIIAASLLAFAEYLTHAGQQYVLRFFVF